ncbi:MAG: hypothetical protein DMG44_08525 [Acidobacteria bacterium]|nr:MAG: hypothetical protein DMG44_08525 [Acidobacteriota bacterium]
MKGSVPERLSNAKARSAKFAVLVSSLPLRDQSLFRHQILESRCRAKAARSHRAGSSMELRGDYPYLHAAP